MPLITGNITIVGQEKVSSPVQHVDPPVNNAFFEKIKLMNEPKVVVIQDNKPLPEPEIKIAPVSVKKVAPAKAKTNIQLEPRPVIDPEHELLNIGGKVDRQHSTYLVDMLT